MRWDEDETPPITVAEAAPDADPFQRLTVRYLLVWMTAASVLLGLYMAGQGRPSQDNLAMLLGLGLVRLVAAVLYGASLASWWLLAVGWYRGKVDYPRWSGHWICLVISLKELIMLIACAVLLGVLSASIDHSVKSDQLRDHPLQITLLAVPAIAGVTAIGGWLIFIIMPAQAISWKIYAGLRVATELCSVIMAISLMTFLAMANNEARAINSIVLMVPMFGLTGFALGTAAFIAAFVALIIDVAYGRRRDWLHWMGVATALTAPTLGMMLWYGAFIGQTMQDFNR